jgi:hypothetical protein
MCRRAKILIRRKRERERSADGPVGRPEERPDNNNLGNARVAQLVIYNEIKKNLRLLFLRKVPL